MEIKILIIDDESAIRNLLRLNLKNRGYEVVEACDGKTGLDMAAQVKPHLIILDLGLPDVQGLEVLTRIREWTPVPIIVLTVDDSDCSKVQLLESGADDYIIKPFNILELNARIKIALRHYHSEGATPLFVSGALEIDLAKRTVHLGGLPVKLTSTEYEFLKILVKNAGKVVSQESILRQIWGKTALGNPHYLRIYIAQLRKKLEDEPSSPKHIITEPGVGYRLI